MKENVSIKSRDLRSVCGFSLIEVIISLALVFVTVTVFGVAVSTLPLTRTARNQNIAYHVGANKLEELRNTSFTALPSSGSFSDTGLASLANSTANLTITNYQGSSVIKQAVVTITWYEDTKQKNVTLETLLSQNGLGKP